MPVIRLQRGKIMPIPDFQRAMRPLLTAISDGVEHDLKEVKSKLITHFSISDDELRKKFQAAELSSSITGSAGQIHI
jgi:restriction endonuclease Mrr